MTSPTRTAIVDAHAHLYDSAANSYAVFERRDPGFEAFVGDYSAMPRTYLVEDYLAATRSRDVAGIVWHEFISEDPVREVAWAQELASASPVPIALVGLMDFADPGLAERLEIYRSFPNLTAVRQHLGWDAGSSMRRFASRPDLMTDPAWLKGLQRLRRGDLRCGLEVFAPQLPMLTEVVSSHPDIGFTIAVMGWPLDLGPEGFARWRADMTALSRCDNTCLGISAVECIFGMDWTWPQVKPWIATLVELFGTRRCMFGSHLPIDALSYGFERLYRAYDDVLSGFSADERDDVLRGTAQRWFKVPVV